MFKWLLIASLLVSIAFCAFYEVSDRRKLEATESEIAAERAKLKPLAAFDAEVQAFRTKKDALQLRIDIINQLKQHQSGAADAVAMLAAVEGDASIDSVAILDNKNLIINGTGDSDAERVASKFPSATKRVAPDHSYAVQVTR